VAREDLPVLRQERLKRNMVSRWKWIALALVTGAAVFGYRWATSAASVDLEQSRRLVAMLHEDGALVKSSCSPNMATMKGASWAFLNETRQRNVMLALARVCIELGGGPTMEVHEAGSQRLLATFDGRNLGK
jgi:hypothetical protein